MGSGARSLILAAAFAGCVTPSANPAPSGGSGTSKLPDFELTSVDGDPVRLSDHLGKETVLLDFWATWCEPCKLELPHLNRIYQAHKDQGFLVLAIAMDDPSTVMQVAPYARESGFAFPVLLDPNNKATNLYNIHKNAPYTVIIHGGAIVSESTGFDPGSAKQLEQRIEKILAAP